MRPARPSAAAKILLSSSGATLMEGRSKNGRGSGVPGQWIDVALRATRFVPWIRCETRCQCSARIRAVVGDLPAGEVWRNVVRRRLFAVEIDLEDRQRG